MKEKENKACHYLAEILVKTERNDCCNWLTKSQPDWCDKNCNKYAPSVKCWVKYANDKVMDSMDCSEKNCGSCFMWNMEDVDSMVCTNIESPFCGEWVNKDECCKAWSCCRIK